ncbi:MAG TPA: GTPase Era [Steroidobacteraceae bacterium]|nr:GTPase Era [Steroidobacteraceae bacterium]
MSLAAPAPFRSGSAALVGRPNVGKSTLLNALVGAKVSIVTPRPQTTRHRILGIANLPAAQIAFVDTPGLHREGRRALNKAMNRTAAAALEDADLVVLVVEAGQWTEGDELALARIARARRPAIVAVNKIDRVRPRERLLPYLAALGGRYGFLAMVPVSALKADNITDLRDTIAALLPVSPALYPADTLTDRGLPFRVAETVREKLTLELNQEVPYGIAVEVEQLADEADGQLTVDAAIWVEREGQKPIVIGAGGARLKRVGRSARLALNELLGRRVHLNLWVKVRENWADNARALKQLGVE